MGSELPGELWEQIVGEGIGETWSCDENQSIFSSATKSANQQKKATHLQKEKTYSMTIKKLGQHQCDSFS